MQNPTTIWNGLTWETLELEVALAREADGTAQIVDASVGAHELWTPEDFMKQRAMRAGKKPAKPKPAKDEIAAGADAKLENACDYRTVAMKAKK